jgi:hypothetical protein
MNDCLLFAFIRVHSRLIGTLLRNLWIFHLWHLGLAGLTCGDWVLGLLARTRGQHQGFLG